MADSSEALVRAAFGALARGDLDATLELVDADLEWTYLDPSESTPEPQVCHGREELARLVGRGPAPELEEVRSFGARVLVVTRVPGIDEQRARKTGDRNFHVVTVRADRITALRACRSREEAEAVASSPAPA